MGWIVNICRLNFRQHTLACAVLSWIVGTLASQGFVQSAGAQDTVDKDYAGELPRIPPRSVAEAQQSFSLLPGFEIELVAAEPLVTDPVAFAFDAHENLFVVEMRDYSEQESERLGSVALLRDTDGDGQMDQRTTFVEGLSWPTAIWNWRDGVLVAEPPKITWYRDTDGDGQSDQAEVWFDGFQRSNVQGLVNSLRWGVDGFIHGATSSSGADLTQPQAANNTSLALRGRDFAIDPLSKSMQPESGGGQHGMSFNRWGDKFVTSNSDHLQQIIDLDGWLAQHSGGVAIPSLRRSIAEDGPQAEVYRTSPVEPWRIVRTRLRMSGVAPGVVEGGGRAAGYFTGATGTWIMDAEAGFGLPGFDTALVCDVGSNLVHRKQLRSNGLFMTANRIDVETELLRSDDTWFRPVQLGDGPDGALYIADMYREVIEHPKSLPPMIKQHLDLTSGRDRGRIWRLKPTVLAATQPATAKVPADCSDAELIVRLTHPIAWQRRLASQLLVERDAKSQSTALQSTALQSTALRDTALRDVVNQGPPEAAVLALHVLFRLGQLDQATVRVALQATNPHVQAHAIALCRQAKLQQETAAELKQIAARPSTHRVQLELALTAAELTSADRLDVLQKLMVAKDPLVRAIIVTAAGAATPELMASELVSAAERQSWLQLMLPAWSKATEPAAKSAIANSIRDGLAQQADAWFAALRSLPSAADAQRLLRLLNTETYAAVMQRLDDQIVAASEHLPRSTVTSVAYLGLLTIDRQRELAANLLVAATPEEVQIQTIDSLIWCDAVASSKFLLSRFFGMTPVLQRVTLNGLMSNRQVLPSLAEALETRRILTAQIAPDVRQRLLDTHDAALKQRFAKILQAVSADRVSIIEQYADKLELRDQTNEIEAGQAIFARVCAQCHRLNDLGNDVGPPLKQLADKSPQQLLEIILDPNREVDPKYASYTVLLRDDRVFAGIISEEAASQIVLAEAGGKRHTIARSDIAQLRSTGVSLMPVGLEQQVTPEQMNQLISYLKKTSK